MTFRSKIDAWLAVLMIASAVAALFGAFFALREHVGGVAAALLAAVVAGFPLWVLLSTRYTVRDGEVLVESGPFKWRIRAQGITRVVPTHSPLSSPALSLDRLRIEYEQGKWLMVSPLHKEDFLRAVEAAKKPA